MPEQELSVELESRRSEALEQITSLVETMAIDETSSGGKRSSYRYIGPQQLVPVEVITFSSEYDPGYNETGGTLYCVDVYSFAGGKPDRYPEANYTATTAQELDLTISDQLTESAAMSVEDRVRYSENAIAFLKEAITDGYLEHISVEVTEDDEDRLIREGEANFHALPPETQARIRGIGDELLERMQDPKNAAVVDQVFRRGDTSHEPSGQFGYWERKGGIITAMLDEISPITDDMPEHVAGQIDIERQSLAMRAGWNQMEPEELEAMWLESHGSLPYDIGNQPASS